MTGEQVIPLIKLLDRFQTQGFCCVVCCFVVWNSKTQVFLSFFVLKAEDEPTKFSSTVVESPHPYRSAMRKKYTISFPKKVSFLVLVSITFLFHLVVCSNCLLCLTPMLLTYETGIRSTMLYCSNWGFRATLYRCNYEWSVILAFSWHRKIYMASCWIGDSRTIRLFGISDQLRLQWNQEPRQQVRVHSNFFKIFQTKERKEEKDWKLTKTYFGWFWVNLRCACWKMGIPLYY